MDCSLYSGPPPKKELDSGNYWERGEGAGRLSAEAKLMERKCKANKEENW